MKFQLGLQSFWTCPSCDILKEHNVSETASVSVLRRKGVETPLIHLGPLERVNIVVHWSRLVISNGPNWVGSPHPHPKSQITTHSCTDLGFPLTERTNVLCQWARNCQFCAQKFEVHDQVKVDMGWECSTNEEKRNAYSILMGKPEGKRPLGGPGRRWVGNIKMDRREIGWDGMD
jgi:hypothetical protein